ncbi:hypothetical protein [Roseovarius arcticus]|uniref:hypothetical protein n=1 Tax=Roseovarius arcticus TaxID=2547404 RepID=UPI001110F2B1|nr:hypothetical protein [Roseovarius arcticus]
MRKIATCCYCGKRTTLVLRGTGRHELSCAACGAPLHEMKAMPCAAQARAAERAGPKPKSRPKPAPHPYDTGRDAPGSNRQGGRRRRRKPFLREALEEIWDVVEDIFD